MDRVDDDIDSVHLLDVAGDPGACHGNGSKHHFCSGYPSYVPDESESAEAL